MNEPEKNQHLIFNIQNLKFKKGFSLLEIIIVIAIIAIMSTTAVVSFGSFDQTLKVKETGEVIQDTVKRLELEVSRGQYFKNRLVFEKDFLAVESQEENAILPLNYLGLGEGSCNADEIALEIGEGEAPVYLRKIEENGNDLEIKVEKFNKTTCIKDFMMAKEREWGYQLFTENQKSNIIRLIHFNLNRSNLMDPIRIESGTEYTLELKSPYGKKQIYKGQVEDEGPIELVLANEVGAQEEVKLK